MLVYWFLPMILFLGIVTSYEDIKSGKIRNKWILFSILYSGVTYIYLFLSDTYGVNLAYIFNLSANSILALIIGFLMWNIGLWRAGDAKLLFAFTILMPVHPSQNYFSFANLLVNTFIPISVYFFIQLITKTTFKEKLIYFRRSFNIKTVIGIALFIFGFSWLISLLLNFLGLHINIFLSLFFVFVIYHFFERILKINSSYIGLLLSLARLLFDSSIYSFQFIYKFAVLVFLFLIIRLFVLSMSSKLFSKELKFNQLKEGMVPAEIVYSFKGKYYKKPRRLSIMGFKKKKIGKLLFKNYNGLAKDDINRLKSLQKRLPFKTLRVQTTIPFAPFIFLGVLLTIIFNGSSILSLVKFINFWNYQ